MTSNTRIPPPTAATTGSTAGSSTARLAVIAALDAINKMALRLTIQQFLQTTKQSFLAAIQENKPEKVMIVSGNQSADLDSIASSILYSYISEFSHSPSSSSKRIFLPLINIPRDEIDLRPEALHLATTCSFTPSDLFFLDDLPSKQQLESVAWVIVDHNARTGPLEETYGQSGISGIIDHHDDEGFAPDANPRIIRPSGSCISQVTNYLKPRWEELDTTMPASIGKSLGKMAMVPVLIDTANMVSKVTKHDTDALAFLKTRNTDVNTDDLYQEFKTAKGAIDDFPMRDLLRKDYKEYTNPNSCTVGISSIGRSLQWMASRDGQSFVTAMDSWSKERGLEVLSIVGNNAGVRGEDYKRYVLIRGNTARTKDVAAKFEFQGKDELQLVREGLDGIDFGDGEDGGSSGNTMCWEQKDLEKSRKQVAPLLRAICAGAD